MAVLETLTKTKIKTGVGIFILVLVVSLSAMFAGFYIKYASKMDGNLTKGLISYWSFDSGQPTDDMNKNNGQLMNKAQIIDIKSIEKNDPKERVKVLSLNRDTKDYVKVVQKPQNVRLSKDQEKNTISFKTNQDFAISAWVKTTAVNKKFQTIVSKASRAKINEREYLLDLVRVGTENAARARFCIYDKDGKNVEQCVMSKAKIKPGKWYNIYVNYDTRWTKGKVKDHVIRMYVNGWWQRNRIVTGYNPKNQNSDLFIGSLYDGIDSFDGLIDDVMIYNRILTKPEFKNLFSRNYEKPIVTPPKSVEVELFNLVQNGDFEDGQGMPPKGWQLYSNCTRCVRNHGYSTSTPPSGSQSFYINVRGGDSRFGSNGILQEFSNLIPGKNYTFKVMAKAEQGIGGIWADNGKDDDSIINVNDIANRDWQEITKTFTAKDETLRLFLRRKWAYPTETTVHWDNVRLYCTNCEDVPQYKPGLVAWWNFDEADGNKAYDKSGTINASEKTCTFVGNPEWTDFSAAGIGALIFDDTNNAGDYLNCGSSADLKTPQFTTMAWVYHADNTKQGDAIFGSSKWRGSFTEGYTLRFWSASDKLQAAFARPGSAELGIYKTGLPIGEFMHLAITYDGSRAKIYKNGQLIGESGLPDFVPSTRDFLIGYDYTNGLDFNQGNIFFNGIIDEFMVFNRALPQTEIKEIYDAIEFCGDGNLNKGEECDWGPINGGDECSTDCKIVNKCKDGKDNDGDGLIDLDDPGCHTSKQENTATTKCQDNIDNDGDGKIDLKDPECASKTGNSETANAFDINDNYHSACLPGGIVQKAYIYRGLLHFEYFKCSDGCDAGGGKGACVSLSDGCDGNY